MKLKFCATVAVILLAAGCGAKDNTADPTAEDTAKPVKTTQPTAPATTAPTGIASGEPIPKKLDVAPGRVGPVTAGMTKAQAVATGYFDKDVQVGGDVCNHIEPLQWKKAYQDNLDVLTTDAGSIAAIGVRGSLKTTKGVGVGSTLGQINTAYGSTVSPAVEAGYGQTGVYVNTGQDWLGFLVDVPFNQVSPASKVTFMEVTRGVKPDLMRDGC